MKLEQVQRHGIVNGSSCLALNMDFSGEEAGEGRSSGFRAKPLIGYNADRLKYRYQERSER